MQQRLWVWIGEYEECHSSYLIQHHSESTPYSLLLQTAGIQGNFQGLGAPVVWDLKAFMHEIGKCSYFL